MINEKVRTKLLEVVENQININNPKCTKENLNRLMDLGYTRDDSIMLIGGILVEEMHAMMKNQVPFNEERYAEKLAKLS
jgi:hypothetical protein